jgi:hypothetical protein
MTHTDDNLGGARTDIDDRAAALRDHSARRGRRAEERPAQIGVDDVVEILLGDVEDIAKARAGGVVNQHVQPPEPFAHPVHQPLELDLRTDICLEGLGLSAGLPDALTGSLGAGGVGFGVDGQPRPSGTQADG